MISHELHMCLDGHKQNCSLAAVHHHNQSAVTLIFFLCFTLLDSCAVRAATLAS